MYRWVEHTAELQLEIEAPSQEAMLEEALAAFAELVGRDGKGEPARHELVICNPDAAARLVCWLEELVFLAETEDFEPEGVALLEIDERELRAIFEGRRGRPAHLVKAVTYHGLEVEERGDGWHARVVLDV